MTAGTTPPLCDAQKPWGGHPSCGRPADKVPSGTMGQWPPATGQWWNERRGGDPKTDQVTQGADSHLPGWQPKDKAAQLPQKGGTLKSAWVALVHQVVEGPRTPASRRHWLLQVVAATAGRRLAMAAIVSYRFLSSSNLPMFLHERYAGTA